MIFKVHSALKLDNVLLAKLGSLNWNFGTSLQRFYLIIQLQPKFWPSWTVPAAPRKRHLNASRLAAAWEAQERAVDLPLGNTSSLFLFLSPAPGTHCKTPALLLSTKVWLPWRHKASWFIFPHGISLPAAHGSRYTATSCHPPQSPSTRGRRPPHSQSAPCQSYATINSFPSKTGTRMLQ